MRVRRRIVTEPGLAWPASLRSICDSIQVRSKPRSASPSGASLSGGGIVCEPKRSAIMSNRAMSLIAGARAADASVARLSPPFAAAPLWQPMQCRASTGRMLTESSSVALTAAGTIPKKTSIRVRKSTGTALALWIGSTIRILLSQIAAVAHANASTVSAEAGPYFSGAIVKLARPWLTLRTAAE